MAYDRYSKVRSGRDRKSILNEVVCEVLQTLAPELQRLDVSVVQGLRGDIPVVFGNRAQLRQVLSNIMRNAIDAMSETTNRSRRLRLKTEARGNDVSVSVEDLGHGIDPAMLETIF